MKKKVVFVLLAIMLIGTCFADEFVNKGMIENASPENSVLIYGFASEPDAKVYYVDEKIIGNVLFQLEIDAFLYHQLTKEVN